MATISPFTETLVHLVIAAVTIFASQKIIQLYWTRRKLPPGPFPWPIIGNILWFRKNNFSHEVMDEISHKYGPVYSLFLGHEPNVIITDPEIGIQVLKKHTFAGRPQLSWDDWIFQENSTDIILSDFGKEWEALRKVGHSAARKYAVSPHLSPIVTDAVDRVIARVGDQPFDSEETFCNLMIAILAKVAFGKKYHFDDPEFIKWRDTVEIQRKMNNFFMVIIYLPFMKHIFRQKWNQIISMIHFRWEYVGMMYQRSVDNYMDGKNETFCDAIITAKKEAEASDNWMTPYLHVNNIINAVSDLFTAGTDTTKMTMRWIFLLMAKHPDLQQKMREDVKEMIGDSDPTIADIVKLPSVCAFISESMRFRVVAPAGIPHKATVDEEVNGHKIPKGTTVIVLLGKALDDQQVWTDPQAFRPDRFLSPDGKYISKPNHLFIPFSDGRRSCPGNKLAFNNMFLMVTRFLQRTREIQVAGGVTAELMKGDTSVAAGVEPVSYSLQLSLKEIHTKQYHHFVR